MHVFLNGRCVPEAEAVVPVSDRGFLYGDGLFETIRIGRGHPFRWEAHLARLSRGAGVLRLRVPFSPGDLLAAVHQLVELNGLPDAVLRLTLTRGAGPRGYSPRGADAPTLVMALHPLPAPPAEPVRVITSSYRIVAGDPLTAVKTCSKITWVMARAEADARGVHDAVLLNTAGHLAEATASNLFWVQDGAVCTPPLQAGALDGVTRALVLELCGRLGLGVCEVDAPPSVLAGAQGVFLTGSVFGVVDVGEWDGRPVPLSPVSARIRSAVAAAQAGA
jgi:aminodeoxychorismate lyase